MPNNIRRAVVVVVASAAMLLVPSLALRAIRRDIRLRKEGEQRSEEAVRCRNVNVENVDGEEVLRSGLCKALISPFFSLRQPSTPHNLHKMRILRASAGNSAHHPKTGFERRFVVDFDVWKDERTRGNHLLPSLLSAHIHRPNSPSEPWSFASMTSKSVFTFRTTEHPKNFCG